MLVFIQKTFCDLFLLFFFFFFFFFVFFFLGGGEGGMGCFLYSCLRMKWEGRPRGRCVVYKV